jgi:phosphatidylglycerol:prolipoprotein diacylglycerol transferase
MYPILLSIGPITIYSLWVFIGLGFFASLLIMSRLIKKNRLKMQFLADHSLSIFFGGLIMSRIFFVIRNYDVYFAQINWNIVLQILDLRDKGLSVWGGITGVILTLLFFCHKTGENKWKWLDVFSVSILGALTIGHIGAFLDGRNFGNETNLPWGVIIENSLYAVPIHPTQIYAAIYCGILTIVLLVLFNYKFAKKEGNIVILATGIYGFFRFLEEFMRGDESNIILGLREAQIYALLAIIISGILFLVRYRKSKKSDHS